MTRSREGWEPTGASASRTGASALWRAAVTGDPPALALLRHGLGSEVARGPELGADGIPSVVPPVPERWSGLTAQPIGKDA